MAITSIDEIQGLTIGVPSDQKDELVGLISKAVLLAKDCTEPTFLNFSGKIMHEVTLAATHHVNALLSAGSVKCHLAAPPEDIDMKLNKAGSLVYRCYHTPAHEWDLTGQILV